MSTLAVIAIVLLLMRGAITLLQRAGTDAWLNPRLKLSWQAEGGYVVVDKGGGLICPRSFETDASHAGITLIGRSAGHFYGRYDIPGIIPGKDWFIVGEDTLASQTGLTEMEVRARLPGDGGARPFTLHPTSAVWKDPTTVGGTRR